jgi:transcription initiation factor IIF auxiliary subunit
VDKFPFEVSETGWGEFQIQIKIYFHDAPEKPLLLVHNLRLYEAGEDLEAQLKGDCRPVVAESYEEIVQEHHRPSLPSSNAIP